MRNDPKVKADGAVNFLGGQDSLRSPSLLAPNQVSFAINAAFRGGYAGQRPPFTQRALTFSDSESLSWFQSRNVQAAAQYRDNVIVSVAGRIFRIKIGEWTVDDITPRIKVETSASFITPPVNNSVTVTVTSADPFQVGLPAFIMGDLYTVTSKTGATVTFQNIGALPGMSVVAGTVIEAIDPNLPNTRQAWMVQAENYFIVQDGKSAAIIYDGSSRRAMYYSKDREIPTGTAMAYGNNRLWVTVNGRQFVAGDINHGPTKVIQFTENDYINEGGFFTVPGDAGNITAMLFMPTIDTALGHGPLQIFTENSVYSVNPPVNREDWKNTNSPIQTMAMRGFGPISDKSLVVVNGDAFYRSRDGIRSYILAIREFNTWGNVPVSSEMHRVTSRDPDSELDLCSAVVFDNRLLFTTSLAPDGIGSYGHALGVLDFNPLASMGQKSPPVWDGFWTGLDFRFLVSGQFDGRERCFGITRSDAGENQFWEIEKDGNFDSGECRIRTVLETRSHAMGSLYELKKLEGAEFWVDRLVGDVDFDLKWRQDQSPCWKDWASWNQCQTGSDCPEGACWTPMVKLPGYRTRMSVPQPPCPDDPSDGKKADLGYEFQLRLEWVGRSRLQRYLVRARETEESIGGNLVI